MSDYVREQLLGHLLHALDDSEHVAVAEQLEADPQLLREYMDLRRQLDAIEAGRGDVPPTPGLAQQTCRQVARQRIRPAVFPSTASRQPMTPVTAPPSWLGGLRGIDVAVAGGILLLASLLIMPAIQSYQVNARRTACENNLAQLGHALAEYSETHGGDFPGIPTEGKLSVAGIQAPILLHERRVTDPRWFFCPADPTTDPADRHIATLEELRAASGQRLVRLQRRMGGSYATDIGFVEDGVYRRPRNLGRTYFAIMTDRPEAVLAGRFSPHHGGRGQNVLFEDLHVRFVLFVYLNRRADDIFRNDAGLIAPGLHQGDAVIAPSGTPLLISASLPSCNK